MHTQCTHTHVPIFTPTTHISLRETWLAAGGVSRGILLDVAKRGSEFLLSTNSQVLSSLSFISPLSLISSSLLFRSPPGNWDLSRLT
jgi:hypothetical protein